MKPRSHSLNQVVCVTMTAIDATPTISVQRKATTWSERLATTSADLTSERLTDAEVHAPAPLLRLAVDEQALDRIQLVADVEARRTDRRQVAEARARRRSAGRRGRCPTRSRQTLP